MRCIVRVLLAFALLLVSLPAPNKVEAQNSPADEAALTAYVLSQFEAAGDWESLYEFLHLDAKMLIPEGAMRGWYEYVFFPSRPTAINVLDVRFVSWTWDVSGVNYPVTAEVTYLQGFGDGSVIEDVVRLVEDNGIWRWFFGRSVDFVNQQIAQFAPDNSLISFELAQQSRIINGVIPWDLTRYTRTVNTEGEFEDSLPSMAGRYRLGRTTVLTSGNDGLPPAIQRTMRAEYVEPPANVIPTGVVSIFRLFENEDVYDVLLDFVASSGEGADFQIVRQGQDGTTAYVLGQVGFGAGAFPILVFGNLNGYHVFVATTADFPTLRYLINGMVAGL